MATSSDIAALALKHLGVLSAGETPSAADSDEGVDAYGRIYAELQEEGYALWASASVPDYLVDVLMRCVAARLRPMFMTVEPALHDTEMRASDMALKALLRRKATRAPTEMQDF